MEEDFIIEIPLENPVPGDSARSSGEDLIEHLVVTLGISNTQQSNEDSSSKEKELSSSARKEAQVEKGKELPSPQSRYRSYFQVLDDDQFTHELMLRPVEKPRPPISLASATKYLKWAILGPTPPVKRTHYDIVLGISTENLDLDAIEAIVITIQHKTDASWPHNTLGDEGSEYFGITSVSTDDVCFRWKLHEKLMDFEEVPVLMVMEIITRKDESPDYGSIELHYVEILTESQRFYSTDPMYREHRPFVRTVDLNRSHQFDIEAEGPMQITNYAISGDGTRILVEAVAGIHRLLQLWEFKESLPADSESSSQSPSHSRELIEPIISPPNEPIEPQLVAWKHLPVANKFAYDYCLSWNGTQLARICLSGVDTPDVEEEDELVSDRPGSKNGTTRTESPLKNDTAFYNVAGDSPKARAGDGFIRLNVEEWCPELIGFSATSVFHIVATQEQAIRDELFVTCDGLTIKVYNVFGVWNHCRTIHIYSPEGSFWDREVHLKNLHAGYVVMQDHYRSRISVWDIKQGSRLSSFVEPSFEESPEELSLDRYRQFKSHVAFSNDGQRIAIAGKHHVDLFWTKTWTRVATYTIQKVGQYPSIGSVRFINNNTQIMVTPANESWPFYRHNRGFILSADNMTLVEEFITEGNDIFVTTFDKPTRSRAICVGVSQLSLFNLEDRFVLSPRRLKRRCDGSCRPIAPFNDQGLTEATAPSGLRFKADKSIVPVVINGRREDPSAIMITVSDTNDQPIQRMSIPLPKFFKCNSYTFVNECSYLLISLDKLVMVWRMPTSPQDKFTLQLAHEVHHPMYWKVCPHRQVYGLSNRKQGVVGGIGISLDDPITGNGLAYMLGVSYLPLIFENASDFVQQEIIQYIGNKINLRSGSYYGGDVVQYVCAEWMIDNHRPTVLLWRALLAHPIWRWIPRHNMVEENNPILCLLDKTAEHPKAFELAEVFINYCIRQARIEKDSHFLLPILQCLHLLMDPKKPYYEVNLALLRTLAYLPARNSSEITSHYRIAHLFEPRWQFWRPSPKRLDRHNDQVLHITSEYTDYTDYGFSRGIYLATFGMLWRRDRDPSSFQQKDVLSWFDIFKSSIFIFKCRLSLFTNPTVICHPFELEALDNPAIAALVEYKWNTIGLQYWLFRFSIQCVYYILVLIAVFMQIYRYENESTMNGVRQHPASRLVRPWRTKLAIELFRSLHLSALSIRASSDQKRLQGGRYDPVNNGLSNNDVGLHVMLMLFFFFTVIVMLNVLIALINHAFDDGDKTWERDWLQNRMVYVTSAENLTYDIPGFRASRDYFPEIIYYTANPIQAREYEKKSRMMEEENPSAVDGTVDSEPEEQKDVSANSGGNETLMAMLKQLQEEQKQAWDEQQRAQQRAHEEHQQARAEQRQDYEGLLAAHEEQTRVAEALRKEVVLLKERLQ
ncbi:hypothetical protein BGZ95_006229 [Linnemannia exigua]|uniref:Ion transport domain-containing protein n=1 Tax=Linnemannia exigua TaxID=604196 RepID=A0AAD4DLD9_9FUNG|nr:hypothetical protein BGZ95_006229 [Linnemannia exigua]